MILQERLDAYKTDFEKKMPAEKLAIMHRATVDLRRSGILDRVIKVGEPIPEFTLPTHVGRWSAPPICTAGGRWC